MDGLKHFAISVESMTEEEALKYFAISAKTMSEEEASKQFLPQPDEDTYDWATVQETVIFKANEFSEGFGIVKLRGRTFRIRQRGWLICYIPQK